MASEPPWHDAFEDMGGTIYLSAASRTPLPKRCAAVGKAALESKCLPWQLDGDKRPDALREAFATLVGSESGGDQVAIMPSTSYCMTLVSRSLAQVAQEAGGELRVVCVADQNSSAVLPWQAVGAKLVFVDGTSEAITAQVEVELEANAEHGGNTVSVINLPPLRWTDGTLIELNKIAAARDALSPSTLLIVDATQGLGVIPLDVNKLGVDVAVASVHKWLCGVYGAALVAVSLRARALLSPLDVHERARAGGSSDGCLPYEPGSGPGSLLLGCCPVAQRRFGLL